MAKTLSYVLGASAVAVIGIAGWYTGVDISPIANFVSQWGASTLGLATFGWGGYKIRELTNKNAALQSALKDAIDAQPALKAKLESDRQALESERADLQKARVALENEKAIVAQTRAHQKAKKAELDNRELELERRAEDLEHIAGLINNEEDAEVASEVSATPVLGRTRVSPSTSPIGPNDPPVKKLPDAFIFGYDKFRGEQPPLKPAVSDDLLAASDEVISDDTDKEVESITSRSSKSPKQSASLH